MRHLLILVLLGSAVFAFAQTAKYTETSIPVRDGRALAADLYIKDSTSKKPTILIQTPYNKNFFRIAVFLPQGGGIGFPYDSLQYNYVIVDWRGFFASKDAGVGKPTYDRGLDGYDIVEWIAAQQWSDGKVGMWGGSALGLIQFQTAKHRPPHLVCAMPFIIDYKSEYEKYFPGGVFLREHYDRVEALGLLSNDLILEHPTYDIYWKIAETITDYPDSINVPLLMVTGWFDHFPDGVIRAYEDLRRRSDLSVRDKHKLVIGPWLHTKIGIAEQGILSYPEAAGVPTDLAFQFFGFYLLGQETAWEASPSVRYFDLGYHKWFTDTTWPAAVSGVRLNVYLNDKGGLEGGSPATAGEVHYDYDPRDPSPSIGSSTFNDTLLHGPQDISQIIETRNDIAVFSTDPLPNDIIVRGKINVKLYVSTDRPDTDFGVRLCDVYPDGRSVIITDAIKRLRFRNSYETEELAHPDSIYLIDIELRNLAMAFLKGHRIRIDITSSNFPRFDLNPNSGGALYQPGDTLIARNTIYTGGTTLSHIEIPVSPSLDVRQLPEADASVIAWPNPCDESVWLSFPAKKTGISVITIYNALGSIVRSEEHVFQAGSNTVPLSLAGLPAGSYYLRFSGHRTGFIRVIKGFRP